MGIFKYPDIPEEYEPYVQFKATIEKESKGGDDLAILSISSTDSHHVLFFRFL